MNAEPTTPSRAEIADEAYKWTVGGGIITVALFPLALPIIALTAIAILPLLLIVLVPALLIAAVAVPILLVKRLVRLRAPQPSARSSMISPPSPSGRAQL
jgi:hypothetical protein